MSEVTIREHVLKNGKKSYEYRFEICSVGGKRKQVSKSGFPSKTAARRAGFEAQSLYYNKGTVIKNSKMSYADYLDIWIEKDCKITLKESTITGYQKRIKNYIKPALGKMNIHSITREDIQDFINDMFDKGFSRNTLSSLIGIVSKSLNYAADNGYIAVSPAIRIKIPMNRTPTVPTRKVQRVNIPEEIVLDILQKFPENTYPHIPILLGYECGLRSGEVFGLVWEDIDFKNKTLTVNRQIQWHQDENRSKNEKHQTNGSKKCGDGYWYFENPKYNSFRTIDISDHLAKILKREYKHQLEMESVYEEFYTHYFSRYKLNFYGKSNPYENINNSIGFNKTDFKVNFVCRRENGTFYSKRSLLYAISIIKKEIYNNFSFHALRHTHASQLYAAGASDKYITERLGHKADRITKDVYIHLTDKARDDGRKILDSLYTKK